MRTEHAGLRTWCVWLFPQLRGGDAGAITASGRVCRCLAAPILLPARYGVVGAENLRDQVIFVNHAPGALAPLDPELIEIRDAVGQLP